jgi:EAL domain-containing protein (putative c-di-GMP-specific phosphodiesterase class I)
VISGPGSIHFHSGGLSRDIGTDRNNAQDLSTALETSEIFAWFQPQIRNLDGKVTGFEALARWDHPERGLLAPACFLRDIEKSGLSQRLAEVVLKQSLIALNIWDASGFDVSTVSVNFSGTELRNPRLPDYIRWELDRHGIAPDRLVIEVLETVASESTEDDVSRTLTALSRIGCRIDLDDFGTGSTSFMNIRRFDVDRIKIDKSLVNKIDCDDAQYAMLSAVLAFGEKLGIDTLAEGVETPGEAAVLASLGCGTMQGYAISRPMPLGETLLWLEDRAETWPLTADAMVRGTA